MMANPWAGEVDVTLDGVVHVARLTLGALAELEAQMHEATMLDIVRRFEAGALSARDVLAVIVAGLRGGGWGGKIADLTAVDVCGGPVDAAKIAGLLVARAFELPEAA